jgi:hypothetical protein
MGIRSRDNKKIKDAGIISQILPKHIYNAIASIVKSSSKIV